MGMRIIPVVERKQKGRGVTSRAVIQIACVGTDRGIDDVKVFATLDRRDDNTYHQDR